MNRIYRLIWCRSRNALIVVSELAYSEKRVGTASRGIRRRTPLLLAGMFGLIGTFSVSAQSIDNAKLADLGPLVDKYDHVSTGRPVGDAKTPGESSGAIAVAMQPAPTMRHRQPASEIATSISHRSAKPMYAGVAPAADRARAVAVVGKDSRGQAVSESRQVAPIESTATGSRQETAPSGSNPTGKSHSANSPSGAVADRRRIPAGKEAKIKQTLDGDQPDEGGQSSDTTGFALSDTRSPSGSGSPLFLSNALMPAFSSASEFSPMAPIIAAVPVVPPPDPAPTGLIVGNGGVVGTTTQLLGPSTDALFVSPDDYVVNGSLRVSNVNFTQGYSTLSALGLPLLNLTPVGTLLTSTGGAVVGGTGINSHLTLIGGVTSDSYINNINNGGAGGLLGLALPGAAPAWASTCLNVLGVLTESCWGVNAAQDYQVLMGDGASANGSKEVVIGTGASHTLPAVDANTAFPGAGTNDPTNPSGVPTADYEARLGHSVVIGDAATGTANAQTILGAEATASVANSVALGFQSAASRGAQSGYTAFGLSAPQTSAGEVSIGSPGQERQITNVAAGSALTDAVNVAQLQGVSALVGDAVLYDDASNTVVTLAGPPSADGGVTGGTTISNLHQGALSATSTDAVNGAQLYATNSSITNIYDTGTRYFQANSTGTGSDAVGMDSVAIGAGAAATQAGGVALGLDAVASTAAGQAGFIPINASVADAAAINATTSTLGAVSVGNASIGQYRQITGVAAGTAATDAVNVAQLSAVDDKVSVLDSHAVQYDANPDGTPNYGSVTLAGSTSTDGGATGGTTISNLHQGALSATSSDAVNGAQLYATNSSITNIYGGGTKYFQANSTGTGSDAVGIDSVAIGAGAVATQADDVALGAGSVTAAAHAGQLAFYGGTAAGTGLSVLSIGALGQERQIQNVAPGVLSAASTDAVNGSQLYSLATGVDVLGSSIASSLGGTSVYDSTTGAVTAGFSYAGGNYNSVQSVLNALTGSGTGQGIKYFHVNSLLADGSAAGTDSVAVGPLANAGGVGSVAIGNAAQANAANAMAFGAGASAGMANSIALGAGSATLVGAMSSYSAYGLVAPQSSLGEVNIGGRQITGVAAGSAAGDAVNVAQLEAVGNQVQSVDKLAVKYDADSSGNATNRITLSGDGSGAAVGITNLAAGAESASSTDAVNGSQLWHWTQDTSSIYSNYSLYNDLQNLSGGGGVVKYFNVNSTLGDSAASGSNSVAIGPVAKASGIDSIAIGNGATASADNSVAIGAGSVADRSNTVSVGSSGSERQITNVAAGSAATDAVNVGQLNASVTASEKGTVHYDTHSNGSVDYSNVTLGNGSSGTTIHNVAAGVADSDAVNTGQLNAGLRQTVNWANAYTDQRVQQLSSRASAGVAAAMAMGGLPQAYEPGKSMAAVAAGTFRGESSLAIGVSTISEGGRWVYKLTGSTDTRGDAGVSIGAGMQW